VVGSQEGRCQLITGGLFTSLLVSFVIPNLAGTIGVPMLMSLLAKFGIAKASPLAVSVAEKAAVVLPKAVAEVLSKVEAGHPLTEEDRARIRASRERHFRESL